MYGTVAANHAFTYASLILWKWTEIVVKTRLIINAIHFNANSCSHIDAIGVIHFERCGFTWCWFITHKPIATHRINSFYFCFSRKCNASQAIWTMDERVLQSDIAHARVLVAWCFYFHAITFQFNLLSIRNSVVKMPWHGIEVLEPIYLQFNFRHVHTKQTVSTIPSPKWLAMNCSDSETQMSWAANELGHFYWMLHAKWARLQSDL